ncbi:MAG: hypothetical protein V7K42_16610 [Nostoc sp.]
MIFIYISSNVAIAALNNLAILNKKAKKARINHKFILIQLFYFDCEQYLTG